MPVGGKYVHTCRGFRIELPRTPQARRRLSFMLCWVGNRVPAYVVAGRTWPSNARPFQNRGNDRTSSSSYVMRCMGSCGCNEGGRRRSAHHQLRLPARPVAAGDAMLAVERYPLISPHCWHRCQGAYGEELRYWRLASRLFAHSRYHWSGISFKTTVSCPLNLILSGPWIRRINQSRY